MEAIFKFLIILAAISILSGCRSDWSEVRIDDTKEAGDKIAIALDNYFSKQDRYPDDLGVLVKGGYIEKIDLPSVGEMSWRYQPDYDRKDYHLSVWGDVRKDQNILSRRGKTNKWEFLRE